MPLTEYERQRVVALYRHLNNPPARVIGNLVTRRYTLSKLDSSPNLTYVIKKPSACGIVSSLSNYY